MNKHIHDISQSDPEHDNDASFLFLLKLLHRLRPDTKFCDDDDVDCCCSNSFNKCSRSEQFAITSG